VPISLVFKFCQKIPKFWKINIIIFLANWQRLLVDCPVDDVVATFKKLSDQHPIV
jgi:hypothetical protein